MSRFELPTLTKIKSLWILTTAVILFFGLSCSKPESVDPRTKFYGRYVLDYKQTARYFELEPIITSGSVSVTISAGTNTNSLTFTEKQGSTEMTLTGNTFQGDPIVTTSFGTTYTTIQGFLIKQARIKTIYFCG